MTALHAFLPPSGAEIWVRCAAAPSMWRRYPDEDSIAAKEGTAAHWAFEQLFSSQVIDAGLVAPNGIVLTEEMVEGAHMYVDEVRETSAGLPIYIEQTIRIPRVHENNWGTPDTFAFDKERSILYLWDYKFGHGYVDEFENYQLMDYAAGLFDIFDIDGEKDQMTEIVLTVVQPRCAHRDGPVRRLRCRAWELRGYINNLRAAAEAASAPNPRATVNSKCKHCSGRHACEALQRSAYVSADISRISVPLDLPTSSLALELSMLSKAKESLDARVSGLEESIHSSIARGERVGGWSLEPGRGSVIWNRPFGEVKTLGEMMGVSVVKDELITPKQAIKKGLPEEVVSAVSESKPGSLKLVQDNLSMLRKVFAK